MVESHQNESLSHEKGKATAQSLALSRREFLDLAWKGLLGLSAALGLGGLWKFLSYQPDVSTPTAFDLGPIDNYPQGIRAKIPAAQAVLIHTEKGLQAFSLVCPHLGCIVDLVDDGFACPCHGSRFTRDGSIAKGPTAQPLTPLTIEVNVDGHLILQAGES